MCVSEEGSREHRWKTKGQQAGWEARDYPRGVSGRCSDLMEEDVHAAGQVGEHEPVVALLCQRTGRCQRETTRTRGCWPLPLLAAAEKLESQVS